MYLLYIKVLYSSIDREDLIKHISKVAKSGKFDYMIIESTGIAEPLPIAQAFYFENEEMRKKG